MYIQMYINVILKVYLFIYLCGFDISGWRFPFRCKTLLIFHFVLFFELYCCLGTHRSPSLSLSCSTILMLCTSLKLALSLHHRVYWNTVKSLRGQRLEKTCWRLHIPLAREWLQPTSIPLAQRTTIVIKALSQQDYF